jgi:hypothetical protein
VGRFSIVGDAPNKAGRDQDDARALSTRASSDLVLGAKRRNMWRACDDRFDFLARFMASYGLQQSPARYVLIVAPPASQDGA